MQLKDSINTLSTLQFFSHAEGYTNAIIPTPGGAVSSFENIYQYKDHLGNVRLSYADTNGDGTIDVSSNPLTNEIVEESNYYPFGLKHKGYNNVYNTGQGNDVAQKKLFNGKEFQDELGLNWHDYGARNYDASLGRWMNIDPLAEMSLNLTPYRFSGNNPILYKDQNGLWEFVFNKKTGVLSLNRQEGDNYDSFLEQTGLTARQARKLFGTNKKGLKAKLNGDKENSFTASSFNKKSKFGRMIQGIEKALTKGNEKLSNNPSDAESDAENNCFRCTINLTTDGEVDSKPLIKRSEGFIYWQKSMLVVNNFDNELDKNYKNVSNPRLGDAVRYSDNNGINPTHGTVFLLKNKDGIQVFTKNGYPNSIPYMIMMNSQVVKTYGNVSGRKNYKTQITKKDGTKKTVTKSDKTGYYRKQ